MTISAIARRLAGSLHRFVLPAVLLIGLSPAGALAGVVDQYTLLQGLQDIASGGSGVSGSASDPSTILGAERDLNVNCIGGCFDSDLGPVAKVRIDAGRLTFSNDDNVTGTALIQWDGVDGVTQLPPDLPQFELNTDLTQGGTIDALTYDVLSADHAYSTRIEAYTDASNYSRITLQHPVVTGDPVTITLPFQDFLDCNNAAVECGSGGPVDFTDLGALQLLLNTGEAKVSEIDTSLSPIRTVLISAQLGDFVWHDLDNDGIQDDGEPGIENVVVKLLACVNGVPGGELDPPSPTKTDADGLYLFDNLTPGDYAVVFVAPDGYVFSPANQGKDDALDSDAVYITDNEGGTACVTLGPGDINRTVDAGLYLPPAGLGDRVWEDQNANGIQENGEPGIPDVTVNLWLPGVDGECNTGDEVFEESTTTDGTGIYAFNDLVPGRYCVEFVKPAICDPVIGGESAFSPANQGTDDTVDSDADTDGKTGNIDLTADQFDPTNDAGVYCPAKIGDFVWNDYNENGIQDDGEAGIPGVTVNLLDCDDNNQVVDNMVTDADGMYMFNPLMPGSYALEFSAPAGYMFTEKNAGEDDAVDSDADPSSGITDCTTLVSNEYDDTWDAGLYLPKQPGIDIEKATNGVDADFPDTGDAPQVSPGDPVAWIYVVTNTGDTTLYNVTVVDDQGVAVSCPKTVLAPGESMECTAEGYAEDLTDTDFTTVEGVCGGFPNKPLYENKGTATGETITGEFVDDVDPSHYCNPEEEEYGRIAPTGATCEDFVNGVEYTSDGWPMNLPSFNMTVNRGKITNVSDPGAAFYFTRFTTSDNVTVHIVQESSGDPNVGVYEMELSSWQLFAVVETESGFECDILEQDKFAKPLQTDESIDLLSLPPAEYALRIRMEPKSIQGETDPGTDLRNDFRTEIDGSVVDRDPDGVLLKRIEK